MLSFAVPRFSATTMTPAPTWLPESARSKIRSAYLQAQKDFGVDVEHATAQGEGIYVVNSDNPAVHQRLSTLKDEADVVVLYSKETLHHLPSQVARAIGNQVQRLLTALFNSKSNPSERQAAASHYKTLTGLADGITVNWRNKGETLLE